MPANRVLGPAVAALNALLLTALSVGASDGGVLDLPTLRAQSPIPAWCNRDTQHSGVWSTSASAGARAYCAELGVGYASLTTRPRDAIESAKRAALRLPNDAAASVLRARSHVLLGEYALALQAFEQAEHQHDFRISDVSTLHQFARAARLGADGSTSAVTAVVAYRRLIALLPQYQNPSWRTGAGIEAIVTLFEAGDPMAARLLLEIRRESDSTRYPQMLNALAALLDDSSDRRAGEARDAMLVYPEALDKELKLSDLAAPKLREVDRDALLALAWEHWDAEQARDRWQAVAARAKQGAWVVQAEKRIRSLQH